MKIPFRYLHRLLMIGVFPLLLTLSGCAGGESGAKPSAAAAGDLPAVEVDHRSPRDTVDWQSSSIDGQPPWHGEADREWPGEAMGLIGPIIAMGGSGAKTFVAVYDPAGVFIGALYLKEARQNPARLENLLLLANRRGAVQNARTVERVAARHFLEQAATARREDSP